MSPGPVLHTVPDAVPFHVRFENRMRAAYLRTMPAPLLTHLDPPLRKVVALARRAAATPLYLRQQCVLWTGSCQGEPTRIALWGKPGSPRSLFDILFDAPPLGTWGPPLGLPAMLHDPDAAAGDADLLLAETTPALAGAFARRGFVVVPDMVRFGATIETCLRTLAHPSKSLASDLSRLRRTGYRVEQLPLTHERVRLFYERYLVPHSQTRFGERAQRSDFDAINRLCPAGILIALTRPGSALPDAIDLVVQRGRTLWMVLLGTRDADPAVLQAGGLAGLYQAAIRLAEERGLRWLDCGRCRPWLADGVARFKWKWGFRPIPDTSQTLEYAVKVLRPASAAAQQLARQGVIVRAGRRFLVLGRDVSSDPAG